MSSLYVVIYYYHLELKVKSGHCTLQIPKINFYFPLTSQFICEEGRNLKLKMKKKTLYFSMDGMREKVRYKVNFDHIGEL